MELQIDLGLAISSASLQPGCARSVEDLAAFCDCDPAEIAEIESDAMRKLRGTSPDLLSEIADLRVQADSARPVRGRRPVDNFEDVLEACRTYLARLPERHRRRRHP